MKWTSILSLLRHAESKYNNLQYEKKMHPLWIEFEQEYHRDLYSPKTKELALKVNALFKLPYSDYKTPLTEFGREQARQTGLRLQHHIPLPDAVICSPFLRCRETYREMECTWPELRTVPFYTEELIQERSMGIAALYTNFEVYYALHPEQKELHDRNGHYHYSLPQGEDIPDTRRRNRIWLQTLTREFSGAGVLAIMHHVSILATRANLERMTPEEYLDLNDANPPKNCSVTTYRGYPGLGKNGKLILESYNSVYWEKPGERQKTVLE